MNANAEPYVIVVGVDYSDTGALALEKAFELAAEKEQAEVHAVNVVRNYGEFVELVGSSPTPYRLSMADAQKRLHDYVTERVAKDVLSVLFDCKHLINSFHTIFHSLSPSLHLILIKGTWTQVISSLGQ